MFVLTQQLESPGAFSIASFLASMYQKHVTYKKDKKRSQGDNTQTIQALHPAKNTLSTRIYTPQCHPRKKAFFQGIMVFFHPGI